MVAEGKGRPFYIINRAWMKKVGPAVTSKSIQLQDEHENDIRLAIVKEKKAHADEHEGEGSGYDSDASNEEADFADDGIKCRWQKLYIESRDSLNGYQLENASLKKQIKMLQDEQGDAAQFYERYRGMKGELEDTLAYIRARDEFDA